MQLLNKNIVIIGASSGIGCSCTNLCYKMGANVILIGRDIEKLNKISISFEKNRFSNYTIDFTNTSNYENVIKDAVQKFGKIDGFLYAVGIDCTMPLKFHTTESLFNIFSINVFSCLQFSSIIAQKKYINIKGASFIFLSSVMGNLGQIGKIAYCATKGALISASKAMALEFADRKIRVNTISPGIVDTEMSNKLFQSISEISRAKIISEHPLGIGAPTDVANLTIFLLSDISSWITGTNIIIDGGYSAK